MSICDRRNGQLSFGLIAARQEHMPVRTSGKKFGSGKADSYIRPSNNDRLHFDTHLHISFHSWEQPSGPMFLHETLIRHGAQLPCRKPLDRKSTRLNSSHVSESRMP